MFYLKKKPIRSIKTAYFGPLNKVENQAYPLGLGDPERQSGTPGAPVLFQSPILDVISQLEKFKVPQAVLELWIGCVLTFTPGD